MRRHAVSESPERVDEIFSADVFSRAVMRQRLPKEVYKSLLRTIDRGEPLDPTVADVVAAAMKDWAIENGRHPLHPLVPAADRPDRREARLASCRRTARAGRCSSSPARS